MTAPETFIDRSVSNISQIAIETLNEGEGKFLGIFDRRLHKKTERAIATASATYASQYFQSYGRANLFGIDLSVPLDSIYIEREFCLSFNPASLEFWQSPWNQNSLLKQQFRNDRQPSVDQNLADRTELGIDPANQNRYLVVLGSNGAGKSTFLRKVGLDVLLGKKLGKFLPRTYIPMLIECKTLSHTAVSLEKYLVDLFDAADFPLAEKLTKKALEQGRLLILFDGVDELDRESRQKTIAQIEASIKKYPKNYFIVSDQIGLMNSWQKLMPVVLTNFDSAQITQSIESWFAAIDPQSTAAASCLQALQQPEHQVAQMLAQVPLCLNLLCWVYYHRQTIPANRTLLYQQAIEIWLEQNFPQVNPAAIASWLEQIADQSLNTAKLYFSWSNLIGQMSAESNFAVNGASTEEILSKIVTSQGILSRISSDRLAFSHPSVQDFLTAKYILAHRLMTSTVKESLTGWRWQEVLVFVAGLRTPNADKLLLLIEAEAQTYIEADPTPDVENNSQKLISIWQWADQVTAPTNEAIAAAAKRTAAVFTVFSLQQAFDRQNPLINQLDVSPNHDPLLTNSLKLSQSLGIDLNIIIDNTRSLTNDFRQNLTFALSHPLDIDKLSRNLTRNVARKLAQDRARHLSLSFDRLLSDRPEMSLDRARDLAFVSILAQQLQTIPIFADISSLIAGLESLQAEIPSNNDSAQVHGQFRQSIWATWLASLEIDANRLQLTATEQRSLSEYFAGCCLLVKCRSAAVDVSPDTWQIICERIVKPR